MGKMISYDLKIYCTHCGGVLERVTDFTLEVDEQDEVRLTGGILKCLECEIEFKTTIDITLEKVKKRVKKEK